MYHDVAHSPFRSPLTQKKHTFPPYTHILVVMYVVFEVTVAVEPQGELQVCGEFLCCVYV